MNKLSSERMMKLMAYADGELEGKERLEIEKLLASDAEAKRVVEQMGTLGDFVRLGHEPKDVDLTDAIMKKVDAEPNAKVASLDAARAKKNRNVGVAVVAALALAASVFVMTRPKEEVPIAKGPTPVETVAPTNNVNASASPGVEVEAVESPGHSVSVFYLPSANELSTSVVVWVDETGEKK